MRASVRAGVRVCPACVRGRRRGGGGLWRGRRPRLSQCSEAGVSVRAAAAVSHSAGPAVHHRAQTAVQLCTAPAVQVRAKEGEQARVSERSEPTVPSGHIILPNVTKTSLASYCQAHDCSHSFL